MNIQYCRYFLFRTLLYRTVQIQYAAHLGSPFLYLFDVASFTVPVPPLLNSISNSISGTDIISGVRTGYIIDHFRDLHHRGVGNDN